MENSINTFINNNLTLIAILGAYVIFLIILEYIFFSVGTYRLMQKRNMESPFLAWIPIAQQYAFGKIYDDIRKKEINGKDPYFRIAMLIFELFCFRIIYTILYLIALKKIFKKYAPNKGSYFWLSLIFSILFLVAPFVPALCLMKASKNDSIEEQQIQTDR